MSPPTVQHIHHNIVPISEQLLNNIEIGDVVYFRPIHEHMATEAFKESSIGMVIDKQLQQVYVNHEENPWLGSAIVPPNYIHPNIHIHRSHNDEYRDGLSDSKLKPHGFENELKEDSTGKTLLRFAPDYKGDKDTSPLHIYNEQVFIYTILHKKDRMLIDEHSPNGIANPNLATQKVASDRIFSTVCNNVIQTNYM